MNDKKTVIVTVLIFSSLTLTSNAFHKLDNVIKTFTYLKQYTRIPFQDAVFLYTDISFIEIIEDIHLYTASIDAGFRLTPYNALNRNTSKMINSFLLKNVPAATFLYNFDSSEDMQRLFFNTLIYHPQDKIWLLQFSKKYKNQEEVITEARKLISTDSNHTSKFSLNSHIYLVVEIKESLQLFEMYRVCNDRPVSVKWVSDIPTRDSISKHVWDHRKNLEQCVIKVGYMDYGAMLVNVTQNTTRKIGSKNRWLNTERLTLRTDGLVMRGFRVQFFKLLQSRLNFSIKWVHVKDLEFGELDNETGNWSGIIGMIQQDEIDTSILDLSWTAERDWVLSYSNTIQRYSNLLFFKKPGPTLSWSTFVNVFDVFYWCSIIATILAITISLYFISFLSRHQKPLSLLKRKETASIVYELSQCLKAFAARDVIENDDSNDRFFLSKRSVMLIMCLCGISNLYVYNAGLISYLMTEKYEIPINELGDILENPELRLLVLKGTADVSFLRDSYDPRYKLIWEKTVRENGIVSSHEEAEKRILSDNKAVYFGISPEVELSADSYPCELMRSKTSYHSRESAYVFKKNSPLTNIFSNQISRMMESGIEQTEIHTSLNKNNECNHASEQSFRTLSYKDIILGFVLLLIGCILAVFIMSVEHLLKTSRLKILLKQEKRMM